MTPCSNALRRLAAGTVVVLAGAWPLAAGAQPQTLASAGLWTAFAATGPDQRPICGLSTTGADGRAIVVQQVSGETGLEVILDKSSWAIPDQTAVDVAFQFDNGGIAAERATGSGTRLIVDLAFDRSVAFMRSLRYGSQIQVHFPSGNEGIWTGGLRGSSAMVDAFNDCRQRFATAPVTGPTQPFAPQQQPVSPPAASPAPTSPAPTSPIPTSPAPTNPAAPRP